jgi:transcription-repair coupling factor (superfamily II helicase)
VDRATLDHVIAPREERLRAVEAYGAGGCLTCHDAELRGAIARLREIAGRLRDA